MTAFTIRKSTEADIGRMLEIYEYARSFMAKTGNPRQWGLTNWPPEALLHEDIAEGRSYVCTTETDGEETVVGTFVFVQGVDCEPTYAEITDGEWADDSAYGVIHRIATSGEVKGVGRFCLEWAYAQCGHMRIDTHFDNKVMDSLLTKLGYEKRGVIYVVEDNDPRYAYEKYEK